MQLRWNVEKKIKYECHKWRLLFLVMQLRWNMQKKKNWNMKKENNWNMQNKVRTFVWWAPEGRGLVWSQPPGCWSRQSWRPAPRTSPWRPPGGCKTPPTRKYLREMNGKALTGVIIMENIESSWNISMDIHSKILQNKYFNDKFSTYIL